MILPYQRFLLDEPRDRSVQPTAGYPAPWRSLWFTGGGARTIAVLGGFGIGAPTATTVPEELVAFGAREFIAIGDGRVPATAVRLRRGGRVHRRDPR